MERKDRRGFKTNIQYRKVEDLLLDGMSIIVRYDRNPGDIFLIQTIINRMENKIICRLKVIQTINRRNPLYQNKDLYRMLYKRDLFVVAYEKIKKNKGATSLQNRNDKDTNLNDDNADGFNIKTIDKIISQLRDSSFQFHPVRRIYIPKPKSKTSRPLGIPSFKDRVVQEALRMILEAIYEPSFSNRSHGFRPNRSCHTCLKQISQTFKGVQTIIEGDIKSAFDTIDHKILIEILSERILDQKFLDLIRKLLKAGYIEPDQTLIKPIIGSPQGGILSPLLANVYLDKLDKHVEEIIEKFKRDEKNKSLRFTPEYSKIITDIRKLNTKLHRSKSTENKKILLQEILDLRKLQSITKVHQANTKPIQIHYVRYADDWIIGINGPTKLSDTIRSSIIQFLKTKLNMKLSESKTKITNWRQKGILFLGYDIRVDTTIKQVKLKHYKTNKTYTKRTTGHEIKFNLPINKVISRLQIKDFCDHNGSPTSKPGWTVQTDTMIITGYNEILNGLINYYEPANNSESLRRIQYILKFSCLKTLAHKHKCSTKKIFKKYGVGSGRTRTITIPLTVPSNKDDTKRSSKTVNVTLNVRPRIKTKPWNTNELPAKDPFDFHLRLYTKSKLLNTHCCICAETETVEMHHIRHVRKAKVGTGFDKILGIINRKQIPVCRECHMKIHNGTYDQMKLADFANPELAKS